MSLPTCDTILLTGGAARRMAGAAKPGLEVGGATLAQRVAAATAGSGRLVVVGPPFGAPADAVTREEPPGSGPVAGIAAGARLVTAPYTAVLAADLPFLRADTVCALRAAALGHDVAVLTDDHGRDQLLCAVWRSASLTAALDAVPVHAGAAVKALFAAVADVARHAATSTGGPPPWFDCDTPAQLDRARRWR